MPQKITEISRSSSFDIKKIHPEGSKETISIVHKMVSDYLSKLEFIFFTNLCKNNIALKIARFIQSIWNRVVNH